MSSIQERLQLKRVPLDTWNVREQLCLASAVVRSGDQNWMSVSRALKTVGEPNRPPDWYSQKSCAAQYGALLEHVETPKRKKRSSEGAVETPQESILKRLTQERIVEIQKNVAEMNQQYESLRDEINEVRNTSTTADRLRDLWAGIEAAKRARERENAKRAQWLKERDERRAKAERTWRPSGTTPTLSSPTSAPPSSPLLTSLLKSSPVVTTPQHISHPANVVDSMSPSAGAPTLSLLLEALPASKDSKDSKAALVSMEHKNQAIENIKSQLVQIELQLKANTTVSSPVSMSTAAVPAVDIDDIEIKAEDVYAFRDVDIHIPPVATMHKGNNRSEKQQFTKKDESEQMETSQEVAEEKVEESFVVEAPAERTQESEKEETVEPTIVFPEVKFPTAEIKVIQAEEHRVKEEVKEVEPTPEVPIDNAEVPTLIQETLDIVQTSVEEHIETDQGQKAEETLLQEEPSTQESTDDKTDEQVTNDDKVTEEYVAPDVEEEEVAVTKESEEQIQTRETAEDVAEELVHVKEEEESEQVEKEEEEEVGEKEESQEDDAQDSDGKRTEDVEDSLPLKEMVKEEKEQIKEEAADTEETHTETDDDTPMELVREEDKEGKTRRDYSRKKVSSRPCSGSESAPDSPGNNCDDKQYRLWKKSIMYVYTRLAGHKYASLFLRPITDEEAPGYSTVIKRPMDLTTIKKLIESGTVRTTVEFQRLILLMLSNALMYNNSDHSVYQMAKELHEEASLQVGMLAAAQAVAGVPDTKPPRRKRSKDPALLAPKRPHH